VLKARRRQRRNEPARKVYEEIIPEPDPSVEIPKEEKQFCEMLLQAESSLQSEVLHNIRIGHFHDVRMRKFIHVLFEQEEHDGTINTDALWSYVEDNVAMHTLLADMLMDPIRPVSMWSTKQTVTPTDDRRALLDAYKKVVRRTVETEHGQMQQLTRDNPSPEVLRRFKELAILLRIEWEGITTFEDIPDIEVEDA
jgi:hypothetical protein